MAIILNNNMANFIRQVLLKLREENTNKENENMLDTAISFIEAGFSKTPTSVTSLCAEDEEKLQKALLKFVLNTTNTSDASRWGEDVHVLPEITKLLMEFIGKRY